MYEPAVAESAGGRRDFLISKTWLQAVVLVVVVGFFVLGLLAYRTYMCQIASASRRARSICATLAPRCLPMRAFVCW